MKKNITYTFLPRECKMQFGTLQHLPILKLWQKFVGKLGDNIIIIVCRVAEPD